MGFSELVDKGNLDSILLVAIVPKTKTGGSDDPLFLSERSVLARDITNFTQDVLYSGVIDAYGDFGYTADIAQCRSVLSDGSLFLGRRSIGRVLAVPISTYKQSRDISHILSELELHGARILIAQAVEDASQSSGWLAEIIFRGAVLEVSNIGPEGAELRFADTSMLMNRIPKPEVTRVDFPDAPDDTIGRAIPIVYGDFSEKPDPQGNIDDRAWTRFTMSNMAGVPCVCTDTNLAHVTDGPIYRVSCHELKSLPIGIGAALKEPDLGYPSLFDLGAWDPINTANYAQIETEWPLVCEVGVRCEKPSDDNGVGLSTKYAYDLEYSGYAMVASTNTPLDLHLRSMPRLGTIARFYVQAWITYASSGDLRLGLWDPDASAWHCTNPAYQAIPAITAGDDYWITLICQIGNDPVQTWDTSRFTVRIEAHTGVCWVREIGVLIVYAPNRAEARAPYKRPLLSNWDPRSGLAEGYDVPRVFPSENQAVYAYCKGHKDDASGTYTGTANALLENAADIGHHLLRTFGGLTADDVETSGGLGDFGTARTELGSYHKLALHVGEPLPALEVFSRICAQSRAIPMYNASGKRGMVVIEPTPEADYRSTSDVYSWEPDRDFYANTFRCGRTSLESIAHRVFVEFDYCYMTDRFRKTTFITPDATDNGFGTDDDSYRKTLAGSGDDRFGEGREFRLRAFDVRNQGVAKSLRNFYFDSLWRPRVWGEFECGAHACDLSVGNVIPFGVEKINGMLVPSCDLADRRWNANKWYIESVLRIGETADDVSRYLVRFLEAIEPDDPSDWIAAADD